MGDSKNVLADICWMRSEISEFVKDQISDGLHNVDADELGKATDMIKDLAETEKLMHEACYYKKISESMEEHDDDDDDHNDPYSRFRAARHRYSKTHSSEDRNDMMSNAHGYLQETMDSIREIYGSADTDLRKKLKADLTKLVGEMTV